jgi:hypothetical protein
MNSLALRSATKSSSSWEQDIMPSTGVGATRPSIGSSAWLEPRDASHEPISIRASDAIGAASAQRLSSRFSHARAVPQSRFTVATEMSSA